MSEPHSEDYRIAPIERGRFEVKLTNNLGIISEFSQCYIQTSLFEYVRYRIL